MIDGGVSIRPLQPDADVFEITDMLHRAYACLAERGLRYGATHQSPEATRRRLTRGHSFVAVHDRKLVGTISVYGPDDASTVAAYRDPKTFHFGQFGVDPEFRGRGIGIALHRTIIEFAVQTGATHLALDTAAPATDLIALYTR